MQDAAVTDGLYYFRRKGFVLCTVAKQGAYLMTKQGILKTRFRLFLLKALG